MLRKFSSHYIVGTNLFDPPRGLSWTASRRTLRRIPPMSIRRVAHGYLAPPATLVQRPRSSPPDAEFVAETHSTRLWADTFPWDAMVQPVAHSFAQRFPKKRPAGGRPSVS